MNQTTVKGFHEKGSSLAKFEVKPPINPTLNKVYFNIDDADDSNLVKHLFYLPFVKKVELKEGFIYIEKFDILEWDEVIDEVADEIKEILNITAASESNSKVKESISIYAESTPNPNAMKFVANKKLSTHSLLFDKIEQTKEAPMINKLFKYEFIKEVFLDENYVSILIKENFEWDHKAMEIREFIQNYLKNKGEIISKNFDFKILNKTNLESKPKLSEIEKKIVSILEEYVKPAVASDGGNIIFDSYDNSKQIVKVLLQGACSGCPSSTYTLKNGIENILKDMLPGKIKVVEAVNA